MVRSLTAVAAALVLSSVSRDAPAASTEAPFHALPMWAQIVLFVIAGAAFIAVMLIAIFGERTPDEKAESRHFD